MKLYQKYFKLRFLIHGGYCLDTAWAYTFYFGNFIFTAISR